MTFSFTMQTTVKYGNGSFCETIPKLLSDYNCRKLLFITGSRGSEVIPDFQGKQELEWQCITVIEEPSQLDILKALHLTESFEPDLIISIGGGSVIDLGKAVSYLAYAEQEMDYFFQHTCVEKEKIPHIAVPTTCGTGAEVTANAVISRSNSKVSLRAESLRPDVAILDPTFTKTMPLSVLYSSSLDSLTQLIESYVSNKAHPLSDLYCKEGLRLFQQSFHIDRLTQLSDDERLGLQLAACCSGIALSNSKLGIIHGLASIIGEQYTLPHGKICSGLLRPFSELNVKVLREQNNHHSLARYKTVSEILHQNTNSTIDELFILLKQYESALICEFKIPKEHFADVYNVAINSLEASSTQGNPVKLTVEQIKQLLEVFYVN